MLNLIRMYTYRLVRMKSFYVILIIVSLLNLTMPLMNKSVSDETKQAQEAMEKAAEADGDDGVDGIGMNVNVHSEGDGNYTFYELLLSPLTAMMFALFIGIFTVIFSTADFSTGDIKNFGGALTHRFYMPVAKAVTLCGYTAFFFLVMIGTSILGVWISGGKVLFRNMPDVFGFLGVQLVLHVAFAVTIMACCQICRSNLLSMILTCCISMHVMDLVYGMLTKALKFAGVKNVKVQEYMLSGRISMYTADSTKKLFSTIVVAVVFLAVSLIGSGWWTTKRDLV